MPLRIITLKSFTDITRTRFLLATYLVKTLLEMHAIYVRSYIHHDSMLLCNLGNLGNFKSGQFHICDDTEM